MRSCILCRMITFSVLISGCQQFCIAGEPCGLEPSATCKSWKPIWTTETGDNVVAGAKGLPIVTAMAVWDEDGPGGNPEILVVGGSFDGFNQYFYSGITYSDGVDWYPMSSNYPTSTGLEPWVVAEVEQPITVRALLPEINQLIVGGWFASADDVVGTANLASWNGSTWAQVGPDMPSELARAEVNEIVRLDGVLYVGMAEQVGSSTLWRLWYDEIEEEEVWQPVGGLFFPIEALAVHDNLLYVGSGQMIPESTPASAPTHPYPFQNVVTFDGRADDENAAGWCNLNGGIGDTSNGSGKILVDAISFDGSVVVSGVIFKSNLNDEGAATTTWGITSWSGSCGNGEWDDLDRGAGKEPIVHTFGDDSDDVAIDSVYDLAIIDGDLFAALGSPAPRTAAGGQFVLGTDINGKSFSFDGVGRWDGTSWNCVTCGGPGAQLVVGFQGKIIVAIDYSTSYMWSNSGDMRGITYYTDTDIDFNNDGSSFDPVDIECFLSVYSEGPCKGESTGVYPQCDGIDFNGDCSIFDPCDLSAFLNAYSEQGCVCTMN